MCAYVIFDVDIRDIERYPAFMKGVKPAPDAAGTRYLARGGALKVHERDWAPRRTARAWDTGVACPARA